MYMIAALVYLIIGGQPYGAPLRVLNKDTFTSLASCQEYLKSDEYGAARERLHSRVIQALEELRTEANAEDQPLPAVAITSSCEQDARL